MLAARRALGLTAKQIASWRQGGRRPAVEVARAAGIGDRRIFAVADRPCVEESASRCRDVGEALELRLGAWSVVVRQTFP